MNVIRLESVYESKLQIAGVENSLLLTTLRGGDRLTAWFPLTDKVYEPIRRGYGDFGYSDGSRYNARPTLAASIFDAVEVGDIPFDHGDFKVILPDGSEFDYLAELGKPYEVIPAPTV